MAALTSKPFFAEALAGEDITLGTRGACATAVASLKEGGGNKINTRTELTSSESTQLRHHKNTVWGSNTELASCCSYMELSHQEAWGRVVWQGMCVHQ